MLGCDVVQGYMHKIPARKKSVWESGMQQDDKVKGASDIEHIAQDDSYEVKLNTSNLPQVWGAGMNKQDESSESQSPQLSENH